MHQQHSSSIVLSIILFLRAYPFALVAGQECACESSATTFHLDPILAKEAASARDSNADAAASLSLSRAIHYRYCELPRLETTAECGTRLHFGPAPVCSVWKTKWLPPTDNDTPIFLSLIHISEPTRPY